LAVAREILSSVQLEGREGRYPHELSGGEQQRLALARALASQPKILLLDEPCSSLDRARRRDMLRLIREILAKDQVTTIYVTHQSDEVSSVAGRVAIMEEGHVGAILPVGEFTNLTESDEG
jgi:ABC-type sulfate/molybdate transport systems ATPase subunit